MCGEARSFLVFPAILQHKNNSIFFSPAPFLLISHEVKKDLASPPLYSYANLNPPFAVISFLFLPHEKETTVHYTLYQQRNKDSERRRSPYNGHNNSHLFPKVVAPVLIYPLVTLEVDGNYETNLVLF